MSLREAQLQFAAEFISLVATLSALALLLLRPQRPFEQPAGAGTGQGRRGGSSAARVAQVGLAGLALVALAGASFGHGSLLISDDRLHWIGLGRVVAAAVLLVVFPYPGGPRTGRTPVGRFLLRVGFLSWLAAGATELASGPRYGVDALLVAGSALVAGALIRMARRSIAVRVAASGATALLLVVIVLASALSAVISTSVQNAQLSRLSARTAVEKAALTDSGTVSTDAQYVEAFLARSFPDSTDNPLAQFATGTPAQRAAAAARIATALASLPARPESGRVGYGDPTGRLLLLAGQARPVTSAGFSGVPDLRPTSCSAGRQGLYEVDSSVWLAASSPECTTGGTMLGVALVIRTVDDTYLETRQRIEPGVSLALVSPQQVLAVAGMSVDQARHAADFYGLASGQQVARAAGDRFVSVVSLTAAAGAGQAPVYLVLADRTDTVLSTRDQLFRTLFLIAFGGTILALGLAVFTGDRITAGLRRLTRASAAIAGGDTNMRAGVTGDDEVAALGSAFDAMVDSVSAQAAALRTAAEDEARLRNRLQAVVAGMTDALVAVDSYGRITDWNEAAVGLTGIPAARALGAPAARIVRVRNEEGAPVARQLLRSGGRSTAMMAWVVRDGQGADVPVAVSSGALRGPDGESAGTVLVFRDMRREQEVERMKTEFLSRIGHELRTPLTGILGYADILLRRPVDESRARAWYEDILQSARRLLRIVEMLEFFASEGAGRVVLRPEPVDVRALVSGIASSWTGRLPPNLSIGRRLPKAEAVVRADQRWLTLAIDELMDNAVKFSPEGGRIVVKVATDGDTVEISVTDQGMGMTAQHHEVIFGDFVQGDNSDTRRFGGLGLGLAVVRRVVEGHGGTITCRSAPGRGTTFIIGLPAWTGAVPAEAAETGPSPTETDAGS